MARRKFKTNKSGKGYKETCDKSGDMDKKIDGSDRSGRGATNDPAWYAVNPELLRDSASFPWSQAAGVEISMASSFRPAQTETTPQGRVDHHYVRATQSGVGIMKLAPTIGFNEDAASPINIAMNAIYTKVRYQNSGHANYDAPDLMIYCLAMADIYAEIQWLMRIYGIASSLFSQRNRFVPEKTLEGEGIDYNSIKNNLSNFRYGVNLLINKAASLCVPGNFTLFLRRAFIYSGIYTEGTSIKDQLYMFSPEGFYEYGLNDDGSGMLEYKVLIDRTTDLLTYDQLLDDVNAKLDAIIESEDCQIMSGDILKAYGENVLKLGTLPEEFTVIPTFDIAVLEQFKNAYIRPGYVQGNDIVQDSLHQYLTCDPTIVAVNASDASGAVKQMGEKLIISTSTATPGPEVSMENTRLMPSVRAFDEQEIIDGVYYYPIHLYTGSEIPVDLRIVGWDFSELEWSVMYPGQMYMFNGATLNYSNIFNRPLDADIFLSLALRWNFKFMPGFWLQKAKAVEGATDEYNVFHTYVLDLDNFTVQDNDVIHRLHETAIMSELATPAVNLVR